MALTTCTTEGIATVVAGFGRGDRIVTSDEEHPGVYGPLAEARRRGAEIVVTEFDRLADAVDVSTTAVVCSHVSWVSGALAPAALASVGVPVVYDGAQGVGAIPVDVKAWDAPPTPGSGQKWLCGPDGSGMLYIAPEFRERVPTLVASYSTTPEPNAGLEASVGRTAAHGTPRPWPWKRRGTPSPHSSCWPRPAGTQVYTRAVELAANLASTLADARPHGACRAATARSCRGSTTTPSRPTSARLDAGVLIRNLPGHNLLRASVGAWNDEIDLERLLEVI